MVAPRIITLVSAQSHLQGVELTLSNGDNLIAETPFSLLEEKLGSLTEESLVQAATPIRVHYHPRMNMTAGEWEQIRTLLQTATDFQNQHIADLLSLTYQEIKELPFRIGSVGINDPTGRSALFLSRQVGFQGTWYTHSQNHYALLNDGPTIWKVWVNLNIGNITKIETGQLPGHYLT